MDSDLLKGFCERCLSFDCVSDEYSSHYSLLRYLKYAVQRSLHHFTKNYIGTFVIGASLPYFIVSCKTLFLFISL